MPTEAPVDVWLEVVKIAGAFLGGGLAGSILTNWRQHRKDKRQPVAYVADATPLFFPVGLGDDTLLTVTVKHGGGSNSFDSLYNLRLILENTGLTDHLEFQFGFQVSSGRAVRCSVKTPGTFHTCVESPPPPATFAAPSPQLAFKLNIFNRGDVFIFDILCTGQPSGALVDQMTSPSPVEFILKQPTSADVAGMLFRAARAPDPSAFADVLAKLVRLLK